MVTRTAPSGRMGHAWPRTPHVTWLLTRSKSRHLWCPNGAHRPVIGPCSCRGAGGPHPGQLPCASGGHSTRQVDPRIARTHRTEAPGRTCQHGQARHEQACRHVAHPLAYVRGEHAALREQCAGRDDEGGLADRAACDQEDSADQSQVEHWTPTSALRCPRVPGALCSSSDYYLWRGVLVTPPTSRSS